jgi:hypothetical protein
MDLMGKKFAKHLQSLVAVLPLSSEADSGGWYSSDFSANYFEHIF